MTLALVLLKVRNFNMEKGALISIWIEKLNLNIIHEQKVGGGLQPHSPPGSGVPAL